MRLLIDLVARDAAIGLACDESLLESARAGGEDMLRLWVSRRAVVVGRSQSLGAECDREAARRLGVSLVRRISGGGAVYHYPGNLNVSITVGNARCLGTVTEAFGRLGESLAHGLARSLRVAVESRGRSLVVSGLKISGAAQARRGEAALLHATLLVRPDDLDMARVLLALRPGYAPPRSPSRPARTVTLAEALGRDVDVGEAADAVMSGLSGLLPRPQPSSMTEDECASASLLAERRYRRPEWNDPV